MRKELTVRGLIIGIIITLVFTAANVYFGLCRTTKTQGICGVILAEIGEHLRSDPAMASAVSGGILKCDVNVAVCLYFCVNDAASESIPLLL